MSENAIKFGKLNVTTGKLQPGWLSKMAEDKPEQETPTQPQPDKRTQKQKERDWQAMRVYAAKAAQEDIAKASEAANQVEAVVAEVDSQSEPYKRYIKSLQKSKVQQQLALEHLGDWEFEKKSFPRFLRS